MGSKKQIDLKRLNYLANHEKALERLPEERLLKIARRANVERNRTQAKIKTWSERIRTLKIVEDDYRILRKNALATIGRRIGKDCPARKEGGWINEYYCLVKKERTQRRRLDIFYATYCRRCRLTPEQIKAKLLFKKLFKEEKK